MCSSDLKLLREYWMPMLPSKELPEGDCPPMRVRLLGEDLVAWRNTDGSVGVMQNACPHRGASMFFGRNEENGLRCVYHGWKFDAEGTCVDMPNEPAESNFKHKIRAAAYAAQEWGGLIWVYMGPRELMSGLPQLDWCLVPDSHRFITKFMQKSNYAQGLEGNIDSSHVSFLHSWFDDEQNARGVRGNFIRDGAPVLTVKETDFGFVYGARREAEGGKYYWRLTPFMLPSFTLVPGPSWPRGGHCVVPVDDHNTMWFEFRYNPNRPLPAEAVAAQRDANGRGVRLIAGTFTAFAAAENDYTIDREIQKTVNYTGIVNGREQDLAIVETMGPVLDRTVEHLGTADTAIIAYRRLMLRLARQLQQGIEPFAATHPETMRVRTLDVVDDHADLAPLMDAHRAEFLTLA